MTSTLAPVSHCSDSLTGDERQMSAMQHQHGCGQQCTMRITAELCSCVAAENEFGICVCCPSKEAAKLLLDTAVAHPFSYVGVVIVGLSSSPPFPAATT
jgi:hypothetical protein